jgi:hypothetical protein
MLLLEDYILNFTCARYYFLYVAFSDFYVNQSLAGQTITIFFIHRLASRKVYQKEQKILGLAI